jgi:hypothetical protein
MNWIPAGSNLYIHDTAPFLLERIDGVWCLRDTRDKTQAIPFSDIFNNPVFPIDLSNADVIVKTLQSLGAITGDSLSIINTVSGTHLRAEGANSPTSPAHSFKNEISTGMYRESAGKLSFSALGNKGFSIDSNGYLQKTNNVAGHFERTTSYLVSTVVNFDTAILNNTNYNTTNGRFTAPVTGIYFFYVQGINVTSSRVGTYFRKNGVQYTNNLSSVDVAPGIQAGCHTAIIQLNQSEYVDVFNGYAGTYVYAKACFFGFYLIG